MKHSVLALVGIILTGFCFIALGQRRDDRLVRNPARGTRGVIAGGTDFAAEAGMRMFQRGGNAVDAGVAAMYAAAVTEYSHFGFGGEAPILIRTKTGKVYAIAGVGTMPKLATADLFRQRKLQAGEVMQQEPGGLKGMVPVAGLMPALVPGMVDAGLLALREFGTRSFADVIQPAIELADGTPLDEMRAGSIARSRRFFELWPVSRDHFLPNGQVPRPGEIFRQPNLARTLRAMAEAEKKALAKGANRQAAIDAVRDYFYRGEVARRIDAFSKAHDGLLRYEDMAAFKLQLEEPFSAKYRGYTVYKPGFWSQGPSMLQTLNILDGYEDRPAMNSADQIHRLAEALKLAYADRDTYYGDPAFAKVPAEALLSREYAAERRKLITNRASQDFLPGTIAGQRGKHPTESEPVERVKIDDALMARDTTCVNAADKDGLVFSATPSGAWLPSVIAGDTGIPLTQRAQSFLLIPGHPNELAGGKRPRVTLSPTIVTQPDGRPYLALSTPGGDNQDQSLIQLIIFTIDYGLNAQAAVEAPRLQTRHLVSSFDNHAWNRGDLLLDERIPQTVFGELATRGHRMGSRSRYNSGAAPVMIRYAPEGIIEGGADPFYYRVAWAW